ncbi:MAG TPA: sialidase family protein [Thermoanaerobaculia bacterium]|nr:sialidase family protein [Thermoanaerobaculia bacterium]
MKRVAGYGLLVALALAGCAREDATVSVPAKPARPALAPKPFTYALGVPQTIRFPFAGESVTPYIAADGNGGYLVSWIERKTSNFNFAALRGGKWFQSRTIASGKLLVNKADFPSIAAGASGILFAHWIERNGHGSRIRIARSDDDGASWSAPVTPHPDIESEFGFASLVPIANGAVQAVWLDGRTLEGGEEGRGDMALHSAVLTKDGKLTNDAVIDPRVCDCCQTGIAFAAGGPLVAYRDRSADELRDISLAEHSAAGWTAPATVHADAWKILGCPVNGPRIAADGHRVAVAWFTAANDRPRVQLALSSDGGTSFAEPIAIDEGHTVGHVDVALLADGSALVSWLEESAGAALVKVRRVSAAGAPDPPVRVASGSSASAIGYPRMAVSRDNAVLAWNGESSVELAAIPLSKR